MMKNNNLYKKRSNKFKTVNALLIEPMFQWGNINVLDHCNLSILNQLYTPLEHISLVRFQGKL